ncbi:MAG: hypothetical protein ACYSU4_08130 [Planctomycetota bacterium]|jgi:hypothetical protein
MNKKARQVIGAIATLFLFIGFIGFVSGFIPYGFVVALDNALDNLDSFELPLGALEGISVDSEGNIYCGLQFYSRIQVYDADGNFIYGKFIDSAGGSFRIRINQNDQLEVATARNDKFYIFARDGSLVKELSDVGHYFQVFGESNENGFHNKKLKVIYFRRYDLFGPYIVKKDSSGEEKVIIKTPFHKWLFKGPLPAWLFIMIGGVMSIFVRKDPLKYISRGYLMRRKQEKKN